jgi:outer membrane protein assembly factor BamB
MQHSGWLLICVFFCGCLAAKQDKKSAQHEDHQEPQKTPVKQAEIEDLRTRKGGTDWPIFLGPTGDSVSSEKGIISPWPKEGLRIVWQRKLGTGYSMPVIHKGRLYQFDRVGDKERLTCLNSETGEFLWGYSYPSTYRDKYNYNNGPRCCPVVEGDRVYIHGAEGKLRCLEARTGRLIWDLDTFAEFGVIQNFFGVGSTPVIEGDLLIVQVGGSPKGSQRVPFDQLKGNGSGVVAFEKYKGIVKYKIADELASYSSPTLATINGRRWCFVFARGGLIAFDPATGKVDFQFPWRCSELESVNASNPLVVGDRVLITECYGVGSALLKVSPGKNEVLWSDIKKRRDKSLECHWMTPIYHDGYVYGSSGRHPQDAELRCVELATGKVVWRQPRLTRSSLLMVDGHFICLGEDGTLRLLKVNPKKYEEVSQFEPTEPGKNEPLLEYPCWAAPILAHGLLYVRGNDRLVCLELIPEKK